MHFFKKKIGKVKPLLYIWGIQKQTHTKLTAMKIAELLKMKEEVATMIAVHQNENKKLLESIGKLNYADGVDFTAYVSQIQENNVVIATLKGQHATLTRVTTEHVYIIADSLNEKV